MLCNRIGRTAVLLWIVASCALVAAQTPPAAKVRLGIDVLEAGGFKPLAGQRVGLVTNPTGVTSDLRSTVDVLANAPGVKLVALYGPEHGVRGDAAAGAKVADAKDAATGLPAYSLYGQTRKPTPEMLRDVDVLVFDIQDIGSRSYTYISTLALVMEAAAENGKRVVVLDRPNPIGGVRVEGRVLDPAFRSFVGQLEIPYVHGMTVGELARMIDGERWLAPDEPRQVGASGAHGKDVPVRRCELTVVPMEGWRREMLWADTGLTWVPTSPHIPRADSSAFYAMTGIIGELGVVSEGVGYPLPFELIGHPELDAQKLANDLNGRGLAGVWFRPAYFTPFYGKLEKKTCGGVQILLADPARVELTGVTFHVLDAVRKANPAIKLTAKADKSLFDKVCGADGVRKLLDAGKSVEELLAFWREGVEEFRRQREKYLLYK